MSPVASSTGPPNPTDERQPLLGSRTGNASVDVQLDPEAAVSADESSEAEIVAERVNYWGVVWYFIFAAFGGFMLAGVIKDFVKNGDIEVRVMMSSCFSFGR